MHLHAGRVVGVLALILAGCGGDAGDGLPRLAVSGTVTLDGQSLAEGLIQFAPSSQGASTPALVDIRGGKYSIERARGLVPDTYQVLISSFAGGKPAPVDEMPGLAGQPPKDLIPARYNAKSTLTAEVKKGGSNTFDFKLTTK